MTNYTIYNNDIDSEQLFLLVKHSLLQKHQEYKVSLKNKLEKKYKKAVPDNTLEKYFLYYDTPQVARASNHLKLAKQNVLKPEIAMTLFPSPRYPDCPAYKYRDTQNQARRENYGYYNLNRILDNLLIGEGPKNLVLFERFFRKVLLQKEVQQIVVIGPQQEKNIEKINGIQQEVTRSKYFDYFLSENGMKAYTLTCIRSGDIVKKGDAFQVYNMTMTELILNEDHEQPQAGEVITLPVYHIADWVDNSDFEFSDNDLDVIEELLQRQQSTFAHCSAGLGRAGVFAYFSYIREHSAVLFAPLKDDKLDAKQQMQQVANNLADALDHLRDIRPGLILREPQLKMALTVGLRLSQRYLAELQIAPVASDVKNRSSITNG